MSGLHKLAGGIAKREREAWQGACRLASCGATPAAGLIYTIGGPQPICANHIPEAERLGYKVYRPENPRGATP